MSASFTHSWRPFADDWALSLTYFPEINGGSFLTSSSGGGLSLYGLAPAQDPISINRRAHESSINAVTKIDQYTVASGSSDGIKIWDLRQGLGRAQISMRSSNGAPILSLASNAGRTLAAGTELLGADAIIDLWDLQKPGQIMRSFVDSHHDDVTALQFHPTHPYLMSGSTDGCVNVYNLAETDEEEALHQVINFASVHECSFVRDNRVSVLSHMETLAFYELNNTNYESAEEPQPHVYGDVRLSWPQCEYVIGVDAVHGYAAYGANSTQSLTLVPFDPQTEQFSHARAVMLSPAHADEVVRDVMYVPGSSTVLTCGEDGLVKAWSCPTVFGETSVPVIGDIEVEETKEKKDKKDKKDKKKEKKEKKDRKEKKKEKRSKGDVRFKPY